MKKDMNTCYPILLALWPYLLVPVVLLDGVLGVIGFFGYCLLTVAVYGMNIVYACRYDGEEDYYELAFWNMVIKLCHIPFYVCTFGAGMLMLLAMVVPALLFVSPVVALTIMVVDYLLLAASSVYGVNALYRAGKRGLLSRKTVLVNGIFHFLFVLDVISAISIFLKLRKQRETEI